jgi:MFS transporter, AAHS family, 4-hydroxybenzoate transporter
LAGAFFDVADMIDREKLGARQWLIALLCGLVLLVDGFDTQAISYVAPVLAREWHLPREVLGTIFSAALAGLMVGYLAVAPFSARFGHKRMLLASTAIFALFTLVTVMATNASELIGLRFLTGIALGAAAPSAVAMICEYVPKRLRATFVLVVYCGFSFGFVLAGFASGILIPNHGWTSLMLAGAIAPIILLLPLALLLPESLVYLQKRTGGAKCIRSELQRIFPRTDVPDDVPFRLEDRTEARASVTSLFVNGRWLGTLLLWIAFSLNLAEFYFMQSWLPTMLTALHYSGSTVVWTTALPMIAGIAAAVPVGLAMDRIGPYVTLSLLYAAGAICMWLSGDAFTPNTGWLMAMVFWAGFCISGGQKGVIGLAAVYYTQSLRSTGVGWALGIGRLGGIAGPLVAGWFYAAHWTPGEIFRFTTWPVLFLSLSVAWMGWVYGAKRDKDVNVDTDQQSLLFAGESSVGAGQKR